MNFLDTITIATVGLTTIAVVFILLTNLFEITKDTLSRMSIEDEAPPETEALDDETIDYDDKATQTDDEDDADDADEPLIAEANISDAPSIVESSISDAPSIGEDQKDPTIWYNIPGGKSRYKGEWKNGLPNGKGIKETFDTDTTQYSIIEGNFVDGFADGYCTQTFQITWNWEKTIPYYMGEFSRNEYHGFGEYHYGDYSYNKGEWRNHKMNGQGAYYSDIMGKTWVGTFYNDKKGIGKWVDGRL